LGSLSGATGAGFSAATFADANQDTLAGMLTRPYTGSPSLSAGAPFPGNIHLVTSETAYAFGDVALTAAESNAIFQGQDAVYYSIGVGPHPTGQVTTDFFTGTDPTPTVLEVPRFDSYLVRLDEYGIPDSTLDPEAGLNNTVGITGLTGNPPTAPSINGATPLADERASFNERATFALGEFRLTQDENGRLVLAIRRSDQDRLIVKDPGGNDVLDQVTVNEQVSSFDLVQDPRFLPQVPAVFVPSQGSFSRAGTQFSSLDQLRRAAATRLAAEALHDYSLRTGQTRFVLRDQDLNRERILDITGFQRP
jgi:hypothetical protein